MITADAKGVHTFPGYYANHSLTKLQLCLVNYTGPRGKHLFLALERLGGSTKATASVLYYGSTLLNSAE